MIDLKLLVPVKKMDDMTEAEHLAEIDAVQAGVCVTNLKGLGHVHIGVPITKDDPTVPVYRFTGEAHGEPGDSLTRYCMATADAAMLLALMWLMKCVSYKDTEVVCDHIRSGATLQMEAARLGVSTSCLWYALRELIGEDAYKALIKQSRAKRREPPTEATEEPVPAQPAP